MPTKAPPWSFPSAFVLLLARELNQPTPMRDLQESSILLQRHKVKDIFDIDVEKSAIRAAGPGTALASLAGFF